MKKEVTIAVVVGLLFGLVIAGGLWRANISFKKSIESENTTKEDEKIISNEFGITIANYSNEDVVNESTITLSGVTKPESWVVVSAEKADQIVKSKSNGTFEAEVTLSGGVNQIVFTVFATDGARATENLTLVYSTEIDLPDEADSENIAEVVKEKVESAINKPRAYIGTVTDITDLTIQITSRQDEIKQISAKDSTLSVVKVAKTQTTVKYEDIAIGDFIVAMGIKNGNDVLNAKRILIIAPLVVPVRTAYFGKILGITKSVIELEDVKSKEPIKTEIIVSTKTTNINSVNADETEEILLKELSEKDEVIVSGPVEDGEMETREILRTSTPIEENI